MSETTKSKKKNKNEDPEEPPRVIKTPADLQRLRLEKLMKNPNKPVVIPEPPRDRNMPNAPDFVRNVMGSSAGAGSGEFHVYRHLRRKEYARQKYIQEKSEREILDEEYHKKLENNKRAAEEKTAKKRAKRLKKKEKAKMKGKKPKSEDNNAKSEDESDSENDEESENKDENSQSNDGVNEDKNDEKKNED